MRHLIVWIVRGVINPLGCSYNIKEVRKLTERILRTFRSAKCTSKIMQILSFEPRKSLATTVCVLDVTDHSKTYICSCNISSEHIFVSLIKLISDYIQYALLPGFSIRVPCKFFLNTYFILPHYSHENRQFRSTFSLHRMLPGPCDTGKSAALPIKHISKWLFTETPLSLLLCRRLYRSIYLEYEWMPLRQKKCVGCSNIHKFLTATLRD